MISRDNTIREYFNSAPAVRNAIKTLRTNIQFSSIDSEIKTLVITSAQQDEGKTTIAIFLGIAMAEAGKRTLIVNADCYKPNLGYKLGRMNAKSWLDLLYGKATMEEVITPTEQKGLYFMDTEPELATPVELIGSNRFSAMIDDLKTSFDMIIFDTPPLGAFIEAALLASKAEGTILLFSLGEVDKRKAQEVIEQLKKANAKILGVVLNKVHIADDNYYRYYNGNKKKKKKPRLNQDTAKTLSA